MAVTITYEYPVAGGVTPPTALQALVSMVSALVTATADGDIAATITHNFAISVADLAFGWPIVIVEMMLPAGWLSTPHVLEAGKTTNAVAVTMSAAGSSGDANPQFRVTVQRPHSLVK